MAKKTVSVEVESSGLDLAEAIKAVVSAARSGGSAAALSAGVAQIVAVVTAAEQIPADAKEDVWEFEKGLALGLSDIAQAAFGPAA